MNYMVFDCETTNNMDDPFCYDNGWCIINDEGETLLTRSYVVDEIFNGEPELMETAYFAEKIPQYREDIAEGLRKVEKYAFIRRQLAEDCKNFDVKAIIAHNMRFDYKATAKTQRWLTSSKYRYFFPYGVELWDSLKMARRTFGKTEEYKTFCRENGYTYGNNQCRFTAEILYRYITGDNNFMESHTGLEDTLIEKMIFLACLAINPDVEKSVWNA